MSDDQPDGVLDRERVADLQLLGPERFGRLVDTYTSSAWDQVGQIESAVAAGDPAAVRRAAHALKGSSLIYGALRVATLTEALESESEEADPALTRYRSELLREELRAAAAALRELTQEPGPT